ncbi:MAG: MmgE/PrpD family protein [Propionibacteriales bacterium]|nr:MmgE/PrpD family protein [Propionibacteriales bacterium]
MVLHRFAEFAVAHRTAPLSGDVSHAATRAVVDWFAATVPGSGMRPARVLRDTLVDEPTSGSARLVPDGVAVAPRTAALINGTAAHTVELDDIYRDGIYHPGAPTVAAVLATAEHVGASGADLLRAVAVGYEVGARIAAAIQPAHYAYWHTTGTVGTIGAAAGASEVLELEVEQFTHALATATTMAAGLQQAFRSDTMSKPLHSGHAAEAGLLGALAAARGFTGAADVLDGAAGFGAAMSDGPDWEDAVARLGSPWAVTTATVKNHACCGHAFAAVDAVLDVRAEGIRIDDIDRITVATYETATEVAGNPNPATEFEAKFSTAYCVAAALCLGSVRPRAFDDGHLHDPRLRDLMKRVTLTVDPDFDASFPRQRGARLRIDMQDGTQHVRVRPTRKGDPDDPLTDVELSDKFDELVSPVLGREGCAALSTALWELRTSENVRGLSTEREGENAT